MTLTEEESLTRDQLLEMYLELLEEVEEFRDKEDSCGSSRDSFDYSEGYDDGYSEGYENGLSDGREVKE